MNNSNWTGRFNRTSRDAFGYTVEFEHEHKGDRLVGLASAFVAGFLFAMWVFAA